MFLMDHSLLSTSIDMVWDWAMCIRVRGGGAEFVAHSAASSANHRFSATCFFPFGFRCKPFLSKSLWVVIYKGDVYGFQGLKVCIHYVHSTVQAGLVSTIHNS